MCSHLLLLYMLIESLFELLLRLTPVFCILTIRAFGNLLHRFFRVGAMDFSEARFYHILYDIVDSLITESVFVFVSHFIAERENIYGFVS